MKNLLKKGWDVAKSISPGLIVAGTASMMETNASVAKETPQTQQNYKEHNVRTFIGVGIIVISAISIWGLWSCIANNIATQNKIDIIAAGRTFGGRKSKESEDELPDDETDDEELSSEEQGFNFDSDPNINIKDCQLVGNLICKGDRFILYGLPGSGKSTLALQIAIDLSLGKQSSIMANDNGVYTQYKVLYYDGESDEWDYKIFFGAFDHSKLSNITLIRDFYENPEKWISDVMKRVKALNKDVVVVLDNLSCICPSMSWNAIRTLFLKHMKIIQEKEKRRGVTITFIVIAHSNKEQNLFGSSSQQNFCTGLIKMERTDNSISKMTIEKSRKQGDYLWHKQYNLEHCRIEGHKGFRNLGVINHPVQSENKDSESNDDSKYYMYIKVAKKLAELKSQKTDNMWDKIHEEFGVSPQCFNNWKKKYGELSINEYGDGIKEMEEEEL